MFRLFGQKKVNPPSPSDAISNLQKALDALNKREAYLEQKRDKEKSNAQDAMTRKNKQGTFITSFLIFSRSYALKESEDIF